MRRKKRQPGDEVEQLAYAVIGAAIEVYRVLGSRFLEACTRLRRQKQSTT